MIFLDLCSIVAPAADISSERHATLGEMTIQRMDNVGIVVGDLDAAVAFFTELGMELAGPGLGVAGDHEAGFVGEDDGLDSVAEG
jgi:hypothetical protein